MDNKRVVIMGDPHFDILKQYAKRDVTITWQTYSQIIKAHGYSIDERPKPVDYTPYFRVEGYKRRGKGTVYRVVRIRDELVIHRLVKSKTKAEESARLMVENEAKAVEREVERTILG